MCLHSMGTNTTHISADISAGGAEDVCGGIEGPDGGSCDGGVGGVGGGDSFFLVPGIIISVPA